MCCQNCQKLSCDEVPSLAAAIPILVMPAHAGIHALPAFLWRKKGMDARIRGHDDGWVDAASGTRQAREQMTPARHILGSACPITRLMFGNFRRNPRSTSSTCSCTSCTALEGST